MSDELGWMSELQREATIAEMAWHLTSEVDQVLAYAVESGVSAIYRRYLCMCRTLEGTEDPRL